jgi:hypothetical protein
MWHRSSSGEMAFWGMGHSIRRLLPRSVGALGEALLEFHARIDLATMARALHTITTPATRGRAA